MNPNLYLEYDIVTPYGCFTYGFIIFYALLVFVLYLVFKKALK